MRRDAGPEKTSVRKEGRPVHSKKVTSKSVATRASEVLRGKGSREEAKSTAQAMKAGRRMTLRQAFDITVLKHGDALKELEKY